VSGALQAAKNAIAAVFSETGVSHDKARENLEELRDEIESLIQCLSEDEE
jgi:hypothetical protein